MEDAMTGDFTDGAVRATNRCRFYFQVECLSDVSGCTATPFGNQLGVQLHTHLEKTTQTTPVLALDRRHNNERKRYMHTLLTS
jgi:hypothetical protein